LGFTQPPVQWGTVFLRDKTAHLHLVRIYEDK
jgi:hypothetical protein